MANKQALRELQTRLANRLQAARTRPRARAQLCSEYTQATPSKAAHRANSPAGALPRSAAVTSAALTRLASSTSGVMRSTASTWRARVSAAAGSGDA